VSGNYTHAPVANDADKGKKGGKESGVMANLPSTRPSRMSRRARPAATPKPTAAKAKPKPAAAKAKPKPAAAKPRLTVAAPTPPPARKPRAVRPASHALQAPPATDSERRSVPTGRPSQSGTELLSTVVQAAGDLASIGITLGGQILKRAADKLPRP